MKKLLTAAIVALTALTAAPAVAGPPGSADLSVRMTDSPDPVAVGSELTYTVTVRNGGPATATGVTATDTLPAGVDLIAASSSQGSCSGTGTVTCAIGTLARNATATATIRVRPAAAGTITNTVSVAADQSDSKPSNNSDGATTTVKAPPSGVDLSLTFVEPPPDRVAPGTPITYWMRVENRGLQAATAAGLRSFLGSWTTVDAPPGIHGCYCVIEEAEVLIAMVPSQGVCTVSREVHPTVWPLALYVRADVGQPDISCDLGAMAPGATATVKIVLAPLKNVADYDCRGYPFSAWVGSEPADPSYENNNVSACTYVSF